MYKDITGIILTDGKSERMGGNISLLDLDGITIIERLVNLMQSIFSEIIVISNAPEEYNFLNLPVFKDTLEFGAPIASIHSGLVHTKTHKNFFIPSNFPLIHEQMIKHICELKSDFPITLCKANGILEQLIGIYSKETLPVIENLMKEEIPTEQNKSVMPLLKKVGATVVLADELDFYTIDNFFKINTPEDYQRLLDLSNYNSYLG